ncbi:MAG: anti-sigma factor [Rhodanobacteraceae bacterium]
MNTTLDHDREDLRHAEYVLGVLDAGARAGVERELRDDPRAVAEVARWQRHLMPLADEIAPVAPPAYVWARLQNALGLASAPSRESARSRASWWNDLALWRWIGLGASAVAAACVIALLVQSQPPPAPAAATSYMVARIEQDNGVPGWTVTMDPAHARLVVVPAAPKAIASNRAPELWLIPQGGKPIAVGVFARNKATSLSLSPELLANLNANALLAVSIEPPGGSPTGQPTGPVIGKGTISGA